MLRGAKSSKIEKFGPAGCAGQVLGGAKSSKKAKFGPAASETGNRVKRSPAANGETPGAHARPGGSVLSV